MDSTQSTNPEFSISEGWVTGPALKTVIALKAFQVGDKIRLKDGARFGIKNGAHDGETATIVALPGEDYRNSSVEDRYVDPSLFRASLDARPSSFAYYIAAFNIAAWRPKQR